MNKVYSSFRVAFHFVYCLYYICFHARVLLVFRCQRENDFQETFLYIVDNTAILPVQTAYVQPLTLLIV